MFLLLPLSLAAQDTFWLRPAVIRAGNQAPLLQNNTADSFMKHFFYMQTAAEWLGRMNAAYPKMYGTAGIQLPATRGTGAAQTAVLWNDVPLNNAMLGVTDLSLVNGIITDGLKITPGSASAAFGNAAMGGTIEMENTMGHEVLEVTVGLSSLKGAQAGMKAAYATGKKSRAETSVFALSNTNEFYYKNTFKAGQPVEKLTHSNENRVALLQQWQHKISEKWSISQRLWLTAVERQLPPLMSSKISEAVLNDHFARYQFEVLEKTNATDGKYMVYAGTETNIYSDPRMEIAGDNRVDVLFASASRNWHLGNLIVGGKWQYYYGKGTSANFLNTAIQRYTSLQPKVFYFTDKWHLQFSGMWMAALGGYFPITGLVSAAYRIKPRLKWNVSAGNSFRLPTLNERYWFPGGNPSIQPETGFSAETGLIWQGKKGMVKGQIYYTQTNNMVFWIPVGGFINTPVNFGKQPVQLYGIELMSNQQLQLYSGSLTFIESWHINAQQIPAYGEIDHIPYLPLNRATFEARYVIKNWQVSLFHQYFGNRYAAYSGNDKLAAFVVGSLTAGRQGKKHGCFAHISNVYNTHYQLISLYPMPGTQVNINYNYIIHKKS